MRIAFGTRSVTSLTPPTPRRLVKTGRLSYTPRRLKKLSPTENRTGAHADGQKDEYENEDDNVNAPATDNEDAVR